MSLSAHATFPRIAIRPFVLGNFWLAMVSTGVLTGAPATTVTNNFVAGDFHVLNDNGAWSWFMDERVLVDNGRLIVGSVRASGRYEQTGLPGWGNIELAIFDLANGAKGTVVLHEHFEQDDHNSPGLLKLGDGRYLAAYSKHGQETKFYLRRSLRPGDPAELVSDPGKAMRELGWTPAMSDLDTIVATAWAWHNRKDNDHG